MALIDVLPQFRYKPLDLDSAEQTKLVARPTPVSVPTSSIPTLATPVSSTNLAPAPVQQPKFNVAEGMAPLVQALNDSSIVSDDAKLAVISQMGLEKGWKTPKDFNYGNIITGSNWEGGSVVRGDHDAKGNPITQRFRTYKSAGEFVNDYLSLLRSQYPEAYAELHSKTFDVNKFTSGLVDKKYKYAQDPNYKTKLLQIFSSVKNKNAKQ